MTTHMLQPIEKFKHRRTFCGLPRDIVTYTTETSWLVTCDTCNYYLPKGRDMTPREKASGKDQLLNLGQIDAVSVIKGIEKVVPSSVTRSRLITNIAAMERRKDAKRETTMNLAYWLEDYRDRRIEIPSENIVGVMTDAKRIPDTSLISLVIDGAVHNVYSDETVWVLPKVPTEEQVAHARVKGEEIKLSVMERARAEQKHEVTMPAPIRWLSTLATEPNAIIQTTLSTFAANKKQYLGYVVDFECGRELRGVVTDVYNVPSQTNWYYVVVDGKIHCMGGGNPIAIEMPKPERPKVFIKQRALSVYRGLREFKGQHIKMEGYSEGSGNEWAGILSDAHKRSEHTVQLVLDGQIYTFANDTEVLVGLP